MSVLLIDRVDGDASWMIAGLSGRCRSEADLRELKVRAFDLAKLADRGDVLAVWGEDRPGPDDAERRRLIAIGGPVLIGERVAELWGVVADDLTRLEALSLARVVARWARLYLRTSGVRRVQASARTTDRRALKWLETIGMRFEGYMRRYGLAGETHARYAMTDEDHLLPSPGGPRRRVVRRLAGSRCSPEPSSGECDPAEGGAGTNDIAAEEGGHATRTDSDERGTTPREPARAASTTERASHGD